MNILKRTPFTVFVLVFFLAISGCNSEVITSIYKKEQSPRESLIDYDELSINGTNRIGNILQTTELINSKNVKIQWFKTSQLDGSSATEISGETGLNYEVKNDDFNYFIFYKITYSDEHGKSIEKFSPLSAKIKIGVKELLEGLTPEGQVESFKITEDSKYAVYLAKQDSAFVKKIYTVNLETDIVVNLTPNTNAHGVKDFFVSNDSKTVVYRYPLTGFDYALYSIPITGGTPKQLNTSVPSGWGVKAYQITEDSTHVVYYGATETINEKELFSVGITGATPPIKLNSPLVAGGDVLYSTFKLTPDSQKVVYISDEDTDGLIELFSVNIDGTNHTKLSNTSPTGWGVRQNPKVLSDSTRVIYQADEVTDTELDIYVVNLDGTGKIKLNGDHTAGGDVSQYEASPDLSRVIYTADQETDGITELYSSVMNTGVWTKINSPLVLDGDVGSFKTLNDSSRVIYLADQDTDTIRELYSVELDGANPPIKITPPLVVNGSVAGFTFTPDSEQVIYLADQETDNLNEIYSTTPIGGIVTKLNDPIGPGVNISYSFITNDSKTLLYFEYDTAPSVKKIFTVDLENHGSPKELLITEVNESIISYNLKISSDNQKLVYLATKEDVGKPELFLKKFDESPVKKINSTLMSIDSSLGIDTAVSDDKNYIVFLKKRGELTELYSKNLITNKLVKLSGVLVTDGNVTSFKISKDSKKVVFHADKDVNDIFNLYSVSISGDIPIRLNPIPASGSVSTAYTYSNDLNKVFYISKQDTTTETELYSVDVNGGVSTKINSPLIVGGYVVKFLISPNNSKIVYYAAQEDLTKTEIYSTTINGGASVKLNVPMIAGETTSYSFMALPGLILPDSSKVVYTIGDVFAATDRMDFYIVDINGGLSIKLSNATVDGAQISSIKLSPDLSRIVYVGDQDSNNVFEIYSVKLDGTDRVKLNSVLPLNGDVYSTFEISSDSNWVVYSGDIVNDATVEVFSSPILGGDQRKINGNLVLNGSIKSYNITADSTKVIYLADQNVDNQNEIFSSNINGSNNTLVSQLGFNTNISSFDIIKENLLLSRFEKSSENNSNLFLIDLNEMTSPHQLNLTKEFDSVGNHLLSSDKKSLILVSEKADDKTLSLLEVLLP